MENPSRSFSTFFYQNCLTINGAQNKTRRLQQLTRGKCMMIQKSLVEKPLRKPRKRNFGSGPCNKPPFPPIFTADKILDKQSTTFFNDEKENRIYALKDYFQVLGRSHRSSMCIERIKYAISMTKLLLKVPPDYEIIMVPGSDTGAMEMLLWNILGDFDSNDLF